MAKNKCPECGTKYKGNFCPTCSAPAPEGAQKKKKHWLLPTIIVLVVIILIAGMGGEEAPKQPSSVQGDPSATVSNHADSPAETAASPSTAEEVTISETLLYSEHGVTVTATKLENGLFGPEISVTISNESDKNITVTSRDLSVNSYMLSASGLYSNVAAGKKAIESITLMASELSEAGIETVADIGFILNVYDSDTLVDIDTSDVITLSTSAAEGFTQPIDDTGDVLYDANGIRVICKGLKHDLIWDGCVVFYIENNSSQYISVYSENVSVNGFMVDEVLWSDLRANTRSIEGMYLLTLENIGLESIDEVETIEFALHIVDENWYDITTTEVITLNFS